MGTAFWLLTDPIIWLPFGRAFRREKRLPRATTQCDWSFGRNDIQNRV